MLALAIAPSAASAQSDFTEFYYNAGVNAHFYYSPRSVSANGALRDLAWTDSNMQHANHDTERLVFHAQLNCSAQTIQNLYVERFSSSSGQSIGTVDLRGQSPVDPYRAGTMGGYLAAKVC